MRLEAARVVIGVWKIAFGMGMDILKGRDAAERHVSLVMLGRNARSCVTYGMRKTVPGEAGRVL